MLYNITLPLCRKHLELINDLRTVLVLLVFLTSAVPGKAQQLDTSAHSVRQLLHRDAFYTPTALILSGTLLNQPGEPGDESFKGEIAEERSEHLPYFRTRFDDYLQYSPIVAAYTLDALGVKSKTDLPNRLAIMVKGELLMASSVGVLKQVTHQLRPDLTTYNSFPSGHTAQAFCAATFLSEEYKDRFPWMPYAAYGVASSVGVLRVMNNRHYATDVLVGAGIGILAMRLAYWTHQYKWNKKKKQIPQF